MLDTYTLLKQSRPRFWMYIVGPYVLGIAAAAPFPHLFENKYLLLLLLFFTFPFNYFLYAVNDIFDRDTDALNSKKKTHEHLVQNTEVRIVAALSAALFVLSVLLFFWLKQPLAQFWFFLLLFLSVFYSAPPLRFKARPFFDAYSNILYALPGFLSYALITGQFPTPTLFFAAAFWTAALHTFSAIPDIQADAQAKIATTAVSLGKKGALWFVGINWFLAAILFSLVLGVPGTVFFIYPWFVFALRSASDEKISAFYWKLPYINTVLGFFGFWYLLIS